MRIARSISLLAAAAAALLGIASPASAVESMTVTAGPVNRGVIAVETLSCLRSDAVGDYGSLSLGGRVLAPATAGSGAYSVAINDKLTHEPIARRDLAPGQSVFSYSWTSPGTERLPALELVVTRHDTVLGRTQVIDRVVTVGQCGWINYAAVPVPNAIAVGHGAAGTSTVVHNPSKVALVTDVSFATYEKNPITGAFRYVNHFRQVTVAAGATRVVTAPPLPCDVPLQVRTATGARSYWGRPLTTGSTPKCGATLPTESVYVAPVPANDPDPCRNPAIAVLPEPNRVVLNWTESGCFGSRINLSNYGFNLSIVVLKPGWSFADYGSTATMVKLKVTNGTDSFVYRAEDAEVRIQ